MALQLIPEIGATGVYTAKTPFDAKLIQGQTYQCMAVRRLGDIIALGEDPYADYYQPNGISDTEYKNDLKEGVCIVSLQGTSGKWVYIPNTYILSYPGMDGVKYHAVVLGIALGAIPVELDITALSSQIDNLVMNSLGVNTDVRVVAVSPEALVPQASHELLEAGRQAKITNRSTDYTRLLTATQELNTLRDKVQELETYIAGLTP